MDSVPNVEVLASRQFFEFYTTHAFFGFHEHHKGVHAEAWSNDVACGICGSFEQLPRTPGRATDGYYPFENRLDSAASASDSDSLEQSSSCAQSERCESESVSERSSHGQREVSPPAQHVPTEGFACACGEPDDHEGMVYCESGAHEDDNLDGWWHLTCAGFDTGYVGNSKWRCVRCQEEGIGEDDDSVTDAPVQPECDEMYQSRHIKPKPGQHGAKVGRMEPSLAQSHPSSPEQSCQVTADKAVDNSSSRRNSRPNPHGAKVGRMETVLERSGASGGKRSRQDTDDEADSNGIDRVSTTPEPNSVPAAKKRRVTKAAPSSRPAATAAGKREKAKAWTDEEEQAAIEIMQLLNSRGEAGGDSRWKKIEEMMKDRGFNRVAGGIKNMWNRKLRNLSGFDERRKKDPNRLATSSQKNKKKPSKAND